MTSLPIDEAPRDILNRLISGFWTTQAIYVAVRLRIPDLLSAGSRTAESLAAETGTHARALYRLLRALSSTGLFREDEQRRFELTPLSECLCRDVPGSLAALSLMRGDWQYAAWGQLLHSVQTGEAAFEHVFGTPLFDHLSHTPDHAAVFDQAMVGVHGRETAAMLTAFDFSSIGLLADIGGGNGSVLAAVLQQHSSVRGLLFDRDHVVDRGRSNLREAGVAERCQFVSGDFFQQVPSGADAYLLRHVLHDWDDVQAATILRRCHDSMSAESRLLIAEYVLPDGPEPFHGKWFDLAMMVVTGGQERTEAEYRTLLDGKGFVVTRIVPTGSELSIIEARCK
jgi:hypothetical protein